MKGWWRAWGSGESHGNGAFGAGIFAAGAADPHPQGVGDSGKFGSDGGRRPGGGEPHRTGDRGGAALESVHHAGLPGAGGARGGVDAGIAVVLGVAGTRGVVDTSGFHPSAATTIVSTC